MAILDVEVLTIDEEKRQLVYEEVIAQQGPPDSTIVVSLATEEEFSDDIIELVLATFGEIGEIILVR